MTDSREYILTLSCKDVRGIVAAVSGFLLEQDGFILESTQYGDPDTHAFFLRMHFSCGDTTPEYADLKRHFAEKIGIPFGMHWQLHDVAVKPNMLIMVSKFDHCLRDLLYRWRSGQLPVEIPAVISNHPDLEELVRWHGIEFYHLPVEKAKKTEQEAKVWDVIQQQNIDLVVLARYMQILSSELCTKLSGKAINIHHSFLPSFKGARPYHQAHARGVKLIGATAHYVTDDLDEGPIIEQEVIRVDHTLSAEDFVAMGRDIEQVVLARAVQYHSEHRVLLNDNKTVVFR
jgi:formyltetrahydrofolate deformylase